MLAAFGPTIISAVTNCVKILMNPVNGHSPTQESASASGSSSCACVAKGGVRYLLGPYLQAQEACDVSV
jgi:hypothetical protein